MKDDIAIPCLLVIVVLALCFLFYLAVEGTKSTIETNCERYGAFYIDDQRYNCEVAK